MEHGDGEWKDGREGGKTAETDAKRKDKVGKGERDGACRGLWERKRAPTLHAMTPATPRCGARRNGNAGGTRRVTPQGTMVPQHAELYAAKPGKAVGAKAHRTAGAHAPMHKAAERV